MNPRSAPRRVTHYEVRVEGHLGERWSSWFDGLTLTRADDGTTALRGPVKDQAELHGLLTKVRDLGSTLLSVTAIDAEARLPKSRHPAREVGGLRPGRGHTEPASPDAARRAHDLNQAARYADHLVVMKEGRIVTTGAPADIRTADLVEEVFELPCVVLPDPLTGTPTMYRRPPSAVRRPPS